MSQQVEVPASQPDELSLTAGIYGELRELTPYKVFADLHINAQKYIKCILNILKGECH